MKKLSKYVQLSWKTHKKIHALEKELEISKNTVNVQLKTIEDKIKTIERLEKEKTYDEETIDELKNKIIKNGHIVNYLHTKGSRLRASLTQVGFLNYE